MTAGSGQQRRRQNSVARAALAASGVSEKTQQDAVFSEVKKVGLLNAGVTPIAWIGGAIFQAIGSRTLTLSALQDNLYSSAYTLAFGTALSAGAAIYGKIGETREASKQMRADRAAGRDPDTPVLDQLRDQKQSTDALHTRSRRVQHLLSSFVRSVKNSLKKTDERMDLITTQMATMQQQINGLQQENVGLRQENAGLRQDLTAYQANTNGQLEATRRHSDNSEQRVNSALNAHRSHMGAELDSVRADVAQHDQKLTEHDDKLARHDRGFGLAQTAVGRLEAAVYGPVPPGSTPGSSFNDQANALHQRSRQQRDQARGRATPPPDTPPGPSLPPTQPGTRPTGPRPRQ